MKDRQHGCSPQHRGWREAYTDSGDKSMSKAAPRSQREGEFEDPGLRELEAMIAGWGPWKKG